MQLIFDITTLEKWHAHPVGIIRTELELVKYILNNPNNISCTFVKFLPDGCTLLEISRQQAEHIVNRFSKQYDNSHLTLWLKKIIFKSCLKKRFKNLLTSLKYCIKRIIKFLIPNQYHCFLKKFYGFYQKFGSLILLKKVCLCLAPQLYRLQFFNLATMTNFLPVNNKLFRENINFKKHDVFISIGLSWDFLPYEFLYYLKNKYELKIIGVLYDVIALTAPEYVQNKKFLQIFFKHFYCLNYLYDRLCCISDFSKEEFLNTVNKFAISKTPTLQTIYLGNNAANHSANNTLIQNKDVLSKENYVLYVSTIEARKNHIILLKAWLKAREQSIEMPNLICVGMMGWCIDDMLALYRSNPWLKEKISFIHNASDITLQKLYANSLFTVFPSHIEGWGLGAPESLAYGKICIISTNPALNEATQGLMPQVNANDAQGWMQIISQLATNTKERARLELVIKKKFNCKSWKTFSEEFIEFATARMP